MPLCLHSSFLFAAHLPLSVMTKRKGKRRNRGRRKHRRSQGALARRRLRGGERLRRALRGLLARRPVRRVLLASAVKIFFQVDIPGRLAPVVLRAAACEIAWRLHGTPTQPFRPEGTPNVKPPDQSHMCAHKWWVEYELGTVYPTLSQYRMYPRVNNPTKKARGARGGRRDRTLYADSPPPSLPGFGWKVPDHGRRRRPKEILLDLVQGEKMGFHPMCLYSKCSVF